MLYKIINIRLSIIIALAIALSVSYYMLVRDNSFHASISSIIQYSQHANVKKHLLILGLLPIYIGVIIFGAAIVGIYLGFTVENLFGKSGKK
ncbi:MAG: hypothetical protein ACD_46C00207G0001 [uncultured bacterium]|nr:MAG: hypothetical protein ACD_46C00207G0001 [uncultured bacterium]